MIQSKMNKNSLRIDPWQIRANIDEDSTYFGVSVSNGMVGIVSSPRPLEVSEVVLNGVYDKYQRGRVENILKGFNHVDMRLIAGNEMASKENISAFSQTLDMKKACLRTEFTLSDKVKVRQEMMALRHLPYTALIVMEIEALQGVAVTPMSVIKAPSHLRNIKNTFSEIDRPHVRLSLLSSEAESPSGRHRLAASNSFIFEEELEETPHLLHEDWDENMHLAKFTKKLEAGQTYRFGMVASTCSTAHYQDPLNEAERLSIFARLEGIESLKARHEAEWENLWESDIEIDGDPSSEKDIKFLLYHLYSFVRKGAAYSLSPVGLSGLGYNGHVFWDTELWMFPPLLLLQPELAKSLLEYRFERIEAARQNAFAHGYKGLMFPWESAEDGSEQTPVWALTGPFQHHITACIGWAFWKYVQLTDDEEFLREKAYPVLKGVAEFWVDRVERKGPGRYEINNVIGANEWEENIDNNAFTNGIARTVLAYAAEAARRLGLEPDPDWEHVAQNIPILSFEDGTTKENETYAGGEIKQADVNLLSFPLDVIREPDQIEKDLAFYGPRMSPDGPAMGNAALATLYARLGETQKAFRMWELSYKPNMVPPFGVMAECAGGKGVSPFFITGAGGALQTILYGFGGLELTNNGLIQLNASLPAHWEKLIIKGVGAEKKRYEVV